MAFKDAAESMFHQDRGRRFLPRGSVYFGPHVADGFDGIHHDRHSAFHAFIHEGFIRHRPRRNHDALPFMGQMLPDFFRNERHIRMQQLHGIAQDAAEDELGR